MKKVIISFIILFLIASGFLTYKFVFMRNKDEKKPVVDTTIIESNKDSSEMEEEENEPITENNENDNDIVKDDSTNDDSTSSNNMESNNVRNSNVVKENKTTTNVKKEEPKQESTQVQQPVTQPEPEQPKHEPTAWESLGISEYDYYHKPMWNWARVDYKIEDYGSFDATHQACIDAGYQLEDIISFSCTNINSYSGAYLGDMLRVKK
ncbi:MAG: hypothetical protein J6C46_09050 [Clostridia bacterium]|nr:hypothetical protein [Clostridia bacterium]